MRYILRLGRNCCKCSSDNKPETVEHDYVEIGGTKWAKLNVGAVDVRNAGMYFQWGYTQGYTAEEINAQQTPDCGESPIPYPEDIGAENDAATVNLGDKWRMPTVEEILALIESVNILYVYIIDENIFIDASVHITPEELVVGGSYGFKLTDKNDQSKYLLFPLSGWQDEYGRLTIQEDTVLLSKTKSPDWYDSENNLSLPSSLWIYRFDNQNYILYNTIDTSDGRRYVIRPVTD